MTREGMRIAIVGMGPRGVGALEALARRLPEGAMADVDVFDPQEPVGAGPNFSPAQSPHCLLNLPVREVRIDPPPGQGRSLGTFAEWLGAARADPERYPPRGELGRYLAARYQALTEGSCPALRVSHSALKVTGVVPAEGGWMIRAGEELHGPYSAVLLTPGLPSVAPDAQMERWRDHAQSHGLDLLPVYPDHALLAAARRWQGRTVAIRGLGLSTHDALRLLTAGLGGRFEAGRYLRSGHEPARILPFSLDGRPPAPKPASAEIDARFDPRDEESIAFEEALAEAVSATPDRALQMVCDALVAPVARIIREAGSSADSGAIRDWLAVERESPAAQADDTPLALLRSEIAMARGEAVPSIGYVTGQIWRKWQNRLRRGFNPVMPGPETAKALVGFDEGIKRFSYGPPVSASEELVALIEAGLVDLRTVDDPDIELTAEGWHLVGGDDSTTASVMVDSVLPSPDPSRLAGPLFTQLMTEGRLSVVSDGLGLRTSDAAELIGADGKVQRGLALLGPLALGSVIAVDSVHDCFGAAADRWADGVVKKLSRMAA